MEVFGLDLVIVAALSFFVTGIVEWCKPDNKELPKWSVRIISLILSFGIVALLLLYKPMTWQMYLLYSFGVFFGANGLWHTANTVGKSISKNV